MDLFDDILKQASSNTKNASKEIQKIDEAHQKSRKCQNERLVAERKQAKPTTKSPVEKPKFVIPKKKPKEEPSVDKSKVALFLKKREEEKRRALIEKKKQKEELIKLRLQSYGGKANKKIAKQFGSTAIELQQKYGNDREHEEYLKKLQMREEEEADRLNTEWRGSVMKALERKKVVEKMVGMEPGKNGPHRVAINKKNSLRHLTKEDSPGPSMLSSGSSKTNKTDAGRAAMKRRLPPTESDFSQLMKKAQEIQNRKTTSSRSPSPLRTSPPPKKKNTYIDQPRREIREPKFDAQKSRPKPTIENSRKSAVGEPSSHAANRTNEIQNGHIKQQKAPKTVLPDPPAAPPPRRYLPGDIRYQGPPPGRSQANVKTPTNSSAASKSTVKDSRDVRTRVPGKLNGENRSITENRTAADSRRREDPSKRMISREEAIARFKAHERIRLEERRRLEELRRRRTIDNTDEDIDDEEYDSDMDDFIDDSEFDEHLKRGDLEETLRLINPRYDKNRWKLRERMIDDRHMEASYRDIAREEKRSSRIGLIEDIREAQHGKSIAL